MITLGVGEEPVLHASIDEQDELNGMSAGSVRAIIGELGGGNEQ